MSNGRRAFFLLAAASISTFGCSPSTNDMDTGGTVDAANDTGAATTDVGPVTVIHGCTSASYVDRSTASASSRMVMTAGFQYDNPCMIIAPGQEVQFMMDFTMHPIAPGIAPSHASDPAGTDPNPIAAHTTGALYTVMFPTPGYYPFYCTIHEAHGMVGVILVR